MSNATSKSSFSLSLYVDDGLVCCNNKTVMSNLLSDMRKEFEITTSEPSRFVGIEIERTANGQVSIHQKHYIEKMLQRFNMSNCKPSATPACPSVKLSKAMCPHSDEEREEMRNIPYRSAVGSLMYAAVVSRPDIAFIVSRVAKFVENPGPRHWTAVKTIFRYLKGTVDRKITYTRGNNQVTGWCDADWASG